MRRQNGLKVMKTIIGPIFAIVTPFNSQGQIDFTALSLYLTFLQEKGVNSILTNGTTGEFASLTLAERKAILEHSRRYFDGTILNNISSCCISECLELAEHSKDYANALVVLPPYYYAQVPEAGLFDFFDLILSETGLPVYLYHFPKHTQNAVTLPLLERLLQKHENLVGIKDSEANLTQSAQFKLLKNGQFQVFVGSDRLALTVLKQGLNGTVTGGSNPFPEWLVSMATAVPQCRWIVAEIAQQYLDVWSQFRKQYNLGEIPITKVALLWRLRDFPIFVRPPLQSLESGAIAAVMSAIQALETKI